MLSSNEQSSLIDDLAHIGSAITQSNFNIKQYKQQRYAKPLKITNSSPKFKTVSKILTEPNTNIETYYPSTHSKTIAQGLNKSLKFHDTFIPPHRRGNSQPHSQTKNELFFSKISDRYAENQTNRSSGHLKKRNSKISKTKVEHFEKEWSKGKVKQGYLPEWLNAICLQYFPNQFFDKNVQLSALKKLGIDENSLVAKGLQPKNVARLYRGLFVFGMGFNELVNQLTNENMELSKIVWKIYSIVLEYCSKGSLQTVIGEIQRENELKLLQLTSELQRKQKVIEKNEELNEKKNCEIFKEIKHLRQENANLNNEKTVLFDQYNSTEQAFSQQVLLRLKFETKINQIYGLHRELGNKHQKLYHQLVLKAQELKNQAEKYFDVANRISEYKETIIDMREQLVFYKDKSEREGQYLQQSNRQIVNLTEKVTKLQFDIQFLRNLHQQMKVKQKQWQIQRANMNVVLDLRQKSTKQTYKQYQITLQENNRLYISLSDQRKVMEEYEKQKKNFNSKIISIVSQNSYTKRKLEETSKKLESLQQKYKELNKQKEQLFSQNQILQANEDSLREYFEKVTNNIEEMHKLNNCQNQQLTYLQQFHQSMSKILKDKNSKTDSLRDQQATLTETLETLKEQYSKLQSTVQLTTEKLFLAEEAVHLKNQQLQLLKMQSDSQQSQLCQTIRSLNQQLQVTRANLDKIMQEYKNQKFERNTLNNSYNQTLKIIQAKNQEEKNLNVKISLIEGDLSQQKNRYLVLEKNMLKLITEFSALQEQLEETLDVQREAIYSKVEYQHPMIIEDLQSNLVRTTRKCTAQEISINELEFTLEKERYTFKQQLQKTNTNYKWEISKLKAEHERISQNLRTQIAYEKQQSQKQKSELQELQTVAETYRKKIYEKSTSEREQVYKFILEEKKKQIENMLQEMEKLQDQLQSQKKAMAQMASSHQQQILASRAEIKPLIEAELRKQLQQHYDLKMKQIQKEIRNQYLKKEELLKEDRNNAISKMNLQDILKIKNIRPQEVVKELSQIAGFNLWPQDQRLKSREQLQRREMLQSRQEAKKRQEMSKLLKNAYDYYQH